MRTHLGHILKPGDHAKGYLVCNSNYNNDDYVLFQQKQKNQLPDVVLVKKSYPQRRKTTKPRSWKLHGLTMDQGDRTNGNNNKERDLEVFLQDIEEDAELRGMVNLYKKEAPVSKHADASGDADMDMAADSDEAEEDFPEINVDDLLDDIELMTISQPEEPQEE